MSQPSSPLQAGSPAPEGPITRTVAIIKNHALKHRFDIEQRIQDAKFEIVKERQMDFDVESDPEFMFELFGDDTECLGEGPVWVYILERRRAVEVWNTLMGSSDPSQADGNSLRALYGTSAKQNGLMGSPGVETAELQIASLFASSPPFPISDLPTEDGGSRFNTMKSVSSSVMAELQQMVIEDSAEVVSTEQPSVASPTSTSTGKLGSVSGKSNFKARTLPPTHVKPDIVPRMSRASMLRAGIAVPEAPKRERGVPLSKEEMAKTFANVPGHKRATSIAVASTAAPKIAPRMSRAASLRMNGGVAQPPMKRAPSSENKATFDGIPGHKRRESVSVASVAAPVVAPRLNKSATLRAQKDSAPPSSFMFRTPSAPKVPGMSRSNSQASNYGPVSRPSSQASARTSRPPSAAAARPAISRPASSVSSQRPTLSTAKTAPAAAPPVAKPRPRPSSVGAPTIAPRTNKAAALRAQKKAAEEEAAAAAAARAKRASAKPLPRQPSIAV